MDNKENNITTDKPLLTSTNLKTSTITFYSKISSTQMNSNNESSTINDKNNNIPIITSLIQNQNPTISNSINLYKQNITISYASNSNSTQENSYKEYNNKTLNDIISSNTTNNQNSTKLILPETVNIPLINNLRTIFNETKHKIHVLTNNDRKEILHGQKVIDNIIVNDKKEKDKGFKKLLDFVNILNIKFLP